MPPKVVVHGAQLRCTMGNKPSNITVLPGKNIKVENQEVATVEDFQPMTNIAPFGMCQSPSNPQVAAAQGAPQACIPNVKVKWAPGGEKVSITGPPALTDDSKCNCLWGGMISVQDAAQPTVFIGKGVSFGGGGGGAASTKQQSSSQASSQGKATKSAPAKSESTTAPDSAATAEPSAAEDAPALFDLYVRLDIDPADASEEDDVFCLSSSDGEYKVEKHITDDVDGSNETLDLVFENVDQSKSYDLQVRTKNGEYWLFRGQAGEDIYRSRDVPAEPAINTR